MIARNLFILPVLPLLIAAQPPARVSYNDRYGVLEDRNVFLRDRSQHSAGRSGPTTQSSRSAEESFVLTGVAMEDEGPRAYVEEIGKSGVLRLGVGDALARGRIGEIVIDAIAFEQGGQRTWVDVGCDLTGKPSAALAPPIFTGATTEPGLSPDLAKLDANDPSLTIEQRMKLRRAQQLNQR